MKNFDSLTAKDIQKVIDFLIRELYAPEKNNKNLEEGDLAQIITFLETQYLQDLQGQQIEDIHVDPKREKLYIETTFDPDNIEEFVLCLDKTGKIIREKRHPDHPIFDFYTLEEDES